ncbi:trypsin-like serine peptidase [Amycolatopsis viridis]|uniref:Serine protease n=1 Tax=Amycolatopsis viridis TaxID=185678 RepID=A0ABX0SZE8_9PSEU|nr:serine protease [Amycolatopsis viridis]NIH81307.1 hypothetical protein [Amycolatopsis viridis]
MGTSWWRSPAVVVLVTTALIGTGAPAANLTLPVSTADVRDTASTTTHGALPGAPVGALFTGGRHFCTASVVGSPGGDLVLTAAHCVPAGAPQDLYFAPGFHDGVAPFGMWQVTAVHVPAGWAAGADQDLDFAFLTVHQAGTPRPVQYLTGAETLGVDRGPAHDIVLTGYPDGVDSPVICPGRTTGFGAHQQRVACPGFPDGTSGGPWPAAVDPATGNGTVVGVVGGYQQGGDTPDVSYSATFDQDIQDTYDAAVR